MINMKIILLLSLLTPLLRAQETPRNVLFILVDDLGVTDLNLDGSEAFYETPNIRKFARSAVNFTNGYASCPVCSPTRSALMTGQNPSRTRNTNFFGAPNEFLGKIPKGYDPIRDFLNAKGKKNERRTDYPLWPAPYLGQLPVGTTSLAEAFKQRGYTTFFAGKWHLGPEGNYPQDHGFDINIGGQREGGPYGGNQYFSPYGNSQIEDGPAEEHLTERLGRETANFIKANKDHPFFALLSFYSVHTPLMAPEYLVRKYQAKRKRLGLSDDFRPESPRENRTVHSHAVYAAMIESVDSAVGRALEALDEEGLVGTTLVVFTSDNGGLSTSEGSPTSNLPYRAGKGWLYEGGIRVPVLIRDPAFNAAGKTCSEPIHTADYYPTILAATGLELRPEQHRDGVSMVGFLRNPSASSLGRPLFWHYPHWGNQGGAPGTAIRQGKWKLIHWYWPERIELFNLDDDPGETTDLCNVQPKIASLLRKKMDAFLAETDAYMPYENPDFVGSFNKW